MATITTVSHGAYPQTPRRTYLTSAVYYNHFWQIQKSINPTTYQNTYTLVPVTGSSPANCPQGAYLRETGKKIYPGQYNGINQYYVGVFDDSSFLRGYINPNASIFLPLNTDKPLNIIGDDQFPDDTGFSNNQGPPVYTHGDVIADGFMSTSQYVHANEFVLADDYLQAGTYLSTGTYANVGTFLSTGTDIAAGTSVTAGTYLQAGTYLSTGTYANVGTYLSTGADIAAGTSITAGTYLQAGTYLSTGTYANVGTYLSTGTGIAAGTSVTAGTYLQAGTYLSTGTYANVGTYLSTGTGIAAGTSVTAGTYLQGGTYLSTGTYANVGTYLSTGTGITAGTTIDAGKQVYSRTTTNLGTFTGGNVTPVSIDASLGATYTLTFSYSGPVSNFITATNVQSGYTVYLLIDLVNTGSATYTNTINFGSNIREQASSGAGQNLALAVPATTTWYVLISYVGFGTDLVEISRQNIYAS